MSSPRGIPRRILLLGALVGAGCSSAGSPAAPAPETAPTPSAPSTTTQPPRPSPTAAPTPTQTAPALPSRDEIIERYASRTPQQWGTEVDGVVSTLADLDAPAAGEAGGPRVALTFDACGGPGGGDGVDEALIDLLHEHDVAATLFLNARWIRAHESLAAELAADPLFLVACHGTRHVPLSVEGRDAYGIRGTGSTGEVYDELTGNVDWFLEHTGGPPAFTRPGTAHCDEVAAAIARDLAMPIAGFSVNGDGGATFSTRMVRDTLLSVTDGDIVLAHMNRPGGGTAQGCAEAIPALIERGVRFVTMA